jgi:D-sedoheptulose 7-phosphate isomerase
MKIHTFTQNFLNDAISTLAKIDQNVINLTIQHLRELRESNGRLFILGLGGSAGNAQHATNDFRKLAGIEAYSPTDNVSELTARANDDGFDSIFEGWLQVSKFSAKDALFVLSVGGGNMERNVSISICKAIDFCLEKNGKIFGIVGRDGGYTASKSENVIIVPTINPEFVTPHSESIQAYIWHLIVSHPDLKINSTKW